MNTEIVSNILGIARKLFRKHHLIYRVKDGTRIVFAAGNMNIPATTIDITDECLILHTPVSLYETDVQRKVILDCCYKNLGLYWFDQYGSLHLIGKDKPKKFKKYPELNQEYFSLTPGISFEDIPEKRIVRAELIIDTDSVLANPEELFFKVFSVKAYVCGIRKRYIVDQIAETMPVVTFKSNYHRTLFYLSIYYHYMSFNGSCVFMTGFRDIQMLKQRSRTVTFIPTLTANTLEDLKSQIQSIVDNNKGSQVDLFMTLVMPNNFDLEVSGMDLYRTFDNESYSGQVHVDCLIKNLHLHNTGKSIYNATVAVFTNK